jgi:four helix bundle protein
VDLILSIAGQFRARARAPARPQLDDSSSRHRSMSFDHERLEVYQCALELLDLVDRIVDQMPPGRAHLKDQLDRAATSIVLNIAEGAGEFSRADKRRFYRMARRSATESAAILDVIRRRQHGPDVLLASARVLLLRIVSMLVRMSQTGGVR